MAPLRRLAPILVCVAALSACSVVERVTRRAPSSVDGYGAVVDGDITIPAVDPQYLDPPNRRALAAYTGPEGPGTLVVDPYAKFLYLVIEGGQAIRYPVAVGREGRGFRGAAEVGRKAAWPGWQPTANMLRTEPEVYGPFARGIPGGRASPLGARALYLYRGRHDTFYRIHGTNDASSIGNATSAGCIRMFNQDIIQLYELVPRGATVVVRSREQSLAYEGEAMANRGEELAPVIVPADEVYALVAAEEAARAGAAAP